MAIKRSIVGILSLFLGARAVVAGSLEDAGAAHDRGDYVTAAQILRPWAEHGNADAQYNLGVLYRHGRGVPQSDVEAVGWYRLAADQGDSRAQANLGSMYKNGLGVKQGKRCYQATALRLLAGA